MDFTVGTDYEEIDGEVRIPDKDRTVLDWYAGLPILPTPDLIRSAFPEARRVLVLIDAGRWDFGNIDPSLKSILSADAVEVCGGRCQQLSLYVWQPEQLESP